MILWMKVGGDRNFGFWDSMQRIGLLEMMEGLMDFLRVGIIGFKIAYGISMETMAANLCFVKNRGERNRALSSPSRLFGFFFFLFGE